MDAEDQKVTAAPPKFSRYRSVRRAAEKHQSTPSPQLPEAAQIEKKDGAVKRSMSRYRHGGSKSVGGRAAHAAHVPGLPLAAKPPSVWSGDYTGALELESDAKSLEAPAKRGLNSDGFDGQTVAPVREEQERHARKVRRGNLRADSSPVKSMADTHSKGPSNGHQGPFQVSHDLERGTSTEGTVSGAALAGFDAPLSAVNAGERRVCVKFQKSMATFPVTPSTTVLEILSLSTTKLASDIDVKVMSIIEHYRDLGLERPLRHYEYVRDVLNSWDHDDQNYLVLVHPAGDRNDSDLDIKGAPKEQPSNMAVHLYHSQKPDTWDKRWITLRADGQVVLSKEEGSTDTKNICHMSDFDVYTPTSRQMRRLCPPKKYCFAIKSQQKSAVFLSTANFVHFFATKDKVMGENWYKAVQQWRSWYLVRVMGNGQSQPVSNIGLVKRASVAHSHHGRTLSLSSANANGSPQREGRTAQISRPIRERSAPPVSFPKNFTEPEPSSPFRLQKQNQMLPQSPFPLHSPEQGAFTINALDRSFSQRHKASEQRTGSPKSDKDASGLTRSISKRQKQVPILSPLVDLTPQYQELPHHLKKGHGVVVGKIPAGGLVEIATTPKVPVPVPPATTNIRPKTAHVSGITTHQINPVPMTPLIESAGDPLKEDPVPDAFTGGLLGDLGAVKRTPTQRTRAATVGNRNGVEPLLDMQTPSKYLPGSLLAKVERIAPEAGPLIDRTKRRTGIIATTGEGL